MQNPNQNAVPGTAPPGPQDPIDALQNLTGQATSGMTRQQPGNSLASEKLKQKFYLSLNTPLAVVVGMIKF